MVVVVVVVFMCGLSRGDAWLVQTCEIAISVSHEIAGWVPIVVEKWSREQEEGDH